MNILISKVFKVTNFTDSCEGCEDDCTSCSGGPNNVGGTLEVSGAELLMLEAFKEDGEWFEFSWIDTNKKIGHLPTIEELKDMMLGALCRIAI